MKVFSSYSIGKLQELVVNYIAKNGRSVVTEDGEHTLETEPVCLSTSTPFDEYRISKNSPFGKPYMDEYTKDLINGKESTFVYDYHNRLFVYPISKDKSFCDQIKYIGDKLIDEPTSRRAQAITWVPELDTQRKDVPCLQYIQCHIIDNKLDMNVMFRSNDMLLAFGANAYALTELQRTIVDYINNNSTNPDCTKIGVGTYTHISLIPHIYDIRDKDILTKFLKN